MKADGADAPGIQQLEIAHSSSVFAVVRLATRTASKRGSLKWTSPHKEEVEVLHIEKSGVVGDYNHYRTIKKQSTDDRALSIVTVEALAALGRDGYVVQAGDLGENITLDAPEVVLAAGVRLQAPGLEIELTEPMIPCTNLEQIASIAALPERQRKAFPRACRGRRGWYARVLAGGTLRTADVLMLVPPSSDGQDKEGADGPRTPTLPKVRRWQLKE